MALHLIEQDRELEALITLLSQADRIAFDTEFCREKTLYPQVGLVQLEIDGEIFLVDPLKLQDFGELIKALTQGAFMTIVHAAHEDLEIVSHLAAKQNLARKLPQNLFDTQVAAAFLNRGSSIGLADLLEQGFGIRLAKTETRTDWLARPITDKQTEYAAMDVAYLCKLQELMMRELVNFPQKVAWLQQEVMENAIEQTTDPEPQKIYLGVRGAGALRPKQLRMLRDICAQRYLVCQQEDLAQARFVKNNVLVNLVKSTILEPRTYIKQGVHFRSAKRYGDLIRDTAAQALQDESPILPAYEAVTQLRWLNPVSAALRKHLTAKAKELDIAEDLLCSRRLVSHFFWCLLEGQGTEISRLESGWRAEALGDLSAFKELALEAKSKQASTTVND